jgi:propionyl-CoA carboxylase alpha chain
VLRHDAFLAGDTTTDFLDRVPLSLRRELPQEHLETCALLAALVAQLGGHRASGMTTFPVGWRNGLLPPEPVVFTHHGSTVRVALLAARDGSFHATIGDDLRGARAVVLAATEDGPATQIETEVDGLRHRATVRHHGDRWWVDETELHLVPRFPTKGKEAVEGGLVAPLPGGVVAVEVSSGDTVTAGQLLVVVEAMKMEHRVTAPADGTVAEVRVELGQQVAAGDVLVILQ